jgi:hypothetical protein
MMMGDYGLITGFKGWLGALSLGCIIVGAFALFFDV